MIMHNELVPKLKIKFLYEMKMNLKYFVKKSQKWEQICLI